MGDRAEFLSYLMPATLSVKVKGCKCITITLWAEAGPTLMNMSPWGKTDCNQIYDLAKEMRIFGEV